MRAKTHYLEEELNSLIQKNSSIFKFIQQGSLDGIWYWDLDNQENEWMSPRFWTTLGYDPKEKKHLVSEWQDLIHPEDLQVAIHNFQKHCQDPDYPYDQVVRYRHKDGSTVWVRCRGIAIRDDQGKPVRMLGAHTDLTPQKRIEEELRESELFLNSIIDQSPHAIWISDKDGTLIRTNQACRSLLNITDDEVVGKYNILSDNIVEEQGHMPHVKSVFTKGEIANFTLTYDSSQLQHLLLKDKADVVLDVTIFPIKNSKDNITNAVIQHIDITRQKLAEESLLKGKNTAQQYLDIAGTIFAALNTDGEVTLINKKGCEVLGYKEEEIIGKNWFENFIPEWQREDLIPVSKKLLNGKLEAAEYYENPILTKDGEERMIAWHNTILKDGQGNITGHLSSGEDITERRKSEEALKASEERFRTLFDQSNDAIIIHEAGKIIDVNKKACNMLGYSRDELLELYTIDLNTQDERSKSAKRIKKVLKGVPVVFETRFIKSDGDTIDVEISSNYVDPSRNIIQGIVRDITARKKAEKELRQIAQQLSAHMDNSPLAVVEFDPDFRVIRWSEEAEKVFGWAAEEIVGKTISEMRWVYDEDIEFVNQESKGLLTGKKSRSLAINRNYHKDGSVIYCEWYNSAIYNAEGDLISILSLVLNVTDRKHAEEALKNSLQTSADIVASIPSGLFIYQFEEPDRLILIEGNPEAEQMTNINVQEWIGKEFNEIWPQARESGVTEAYLKVIRTGEIFEAEDLHYKDSRFEGAFKYRAFPIPGKRLGVAFENITEKKKLEAQLQQAQKLESIGTLAGGIAHDFNNILSPIMIHSELAMGDLPPDSPLQFNLKEILAAGARARDLVKQILTFSRKGETVLTKIRLKPILKETLKMLRSTTPTTISITPKIETDNDITYNDPTQIQQIIMNLCTNAVHAMREHGGTLEVGLDEFLLDYGNQQTFPDLKPGVYLRLCVRDTGDGIDKETINNIFEPYFTTKKTGEGTGLGLATVHGIVKNSGGDISVESEIGIGSRFEVLLPGTEFKTETRKVERKFTLPKGSEKILFVDDEASAVDANRAMLESLGYRVTARTSSIEALEAFRNNPLEFDLVITDMTMPNMTGKDLTKELITIRPDIPIIMCTGFSELIDEESAIKTGIKALLMKPIVMHEMANTIRKVLNEK